MENMLCFNMIDLPAIVFFFSWTVAGHIKMVKMFCKINDRIMDKCTLD